MPSHLRPYVRSWMGYDEAGPPSRRRELPGPNVVCIFELGPPIRVTESGDERRWARHAGGFVAGLDDCFSLTEHDGRQAGIQVSLTPLGARVLFDVPLSEIARRVVGLTDLRPAWRSLTERLASTPEWETRFEIVEAILLERIARGRTSAKAVWATRQIELAAGRIDVAELASALGYGRKHLAALFHEHVGFSPKLYARLVRFDRLLHELKTRPRRRWAELALDHGYADQAHLVREVNRFTGVTPTTVVALLGQELPGLFE